MKIGNRLIPHEWACGRAAESHTGNFWTDGEKLYSYQLCIGDTSPTLGKVLRNYTATSKKYRYYSQTTSCHVGRAWANADWIDG